MTRWTTGITTAVAITLGTCAVASAQNATPPPQPAPTQVQAPGKSKVDSFGDRLDITAIPAGALWVRDGDTSAQPGFQSYVPGGALNVRLTRYISVEGEGAFAIGTRQAFVFDGQEEGRFKTPTLFGYTGSVLVNAVPYDKKFVPYGVAGIGGMFMSSRRELGINDGSNFFIGEFGGGAKVMFGKWGVRGDYRFFGLRAQNADASFVGEKTRFANRVYAGLVIAPGRESSGS
jgi:hypothetical protein